MKYIGIGIVWLGAGIAITGTAFGAPEAVESVAFVTMLCAAGGTFFVAVFA